MSVHASKKSSYSYLQEVGAAVFSAFFLSACAASASENVTIHQSEDMQPWQQNAWDNVFDGSKNGQSSGNVFLFDVANTEEEALTGFAFHAASSAPEQAENLIHIQNGYFRARGTQTAFVASYGAEKNASNNRLLVSGGNFLKATGVNFPDDHVILMTAAEGDADLAGNSIVVSGGRFEAPTEMTAALNTSDKLNVLSDNIIRLQAPAQIENWSALTAAVAEGGLLTRNRIEVEGVKSQKIDMLVAAHTEFGDASQNAVVVKDSDIYVRSGIHAAEATSSTPSTVSSNLVFVENSVLSQGNSFGAAFNRSGDVTNNGIIIRNSTIEKPSDAGFVSDVYVYGGELDGGQGTVSGNLIQLENVKLRLEDGQSAYFIAGQIDANEGGQVCGNAVEIIGNGQWQENLSRANLIGGRILDDKTGAGIRGNVLKLRNWRGTLSSIAGFETIALRNVDWKKDQTVLKIDYQGRWEWNEGGEKVFVARAPADLSKTVFAVENGGFVFSDGVKSDLGESMKLVEADAEHGGIVLNPVNDGEGMPVDLHVDLDEEVAGVIKNNPEQNRVDFSLEEETTQNSQLEIVTNHRNMAVAFLGQAGEVISDTLSREQSQEESGSKTFLTLSGEDVRYSSSGRMTIRGFNAIGGAAAQTAIGNASLRVNLFAEAGIGNFDENMRFGLSSRSVDGELKYYGLGASARASFPQNFYVEGSVRGGRIESDIERGLIGAAGTSEGYELDSAYLGAHVAAGYMIDLPSTARVELLVKYFLTYLPSKKAEIDAPQESARLDFQSVFNERVRAGARIYSPRLQDWHGYAGAALEYDFSPDSEVKINGFKINAGKDMRGATGIGEAGMSYRKTGASWLVDMRLRGYVGERKGFSVRAQFEHAF